MPVIKMPAPFRPYTQGLLEVPVQGKTVAELNALASQESWLKERESIPEVVQRQKEARGY